MFDAGVGAGRDRQPRGRRSPSTVAGLLASFGGDRITLALDVRIVDGDARGRDRPAGPKVLGHAACGTSLALYPRRAPPPRHRHRPRRHADRAQSRPDRRDRRALPRSRRAGLGRRLLARRSRARSRQPARPARSSARRCGKSSIGLAEAIDAGALGSSPASTSATGAWSRASASATIATSATSSSMPCAIATKAPTSSSSTTSPPAPRAAASTSTGCAGSPAVIDIPFAVAGGIRSRDEAAACLDAGADKVSINSPALERSGPDRRSSRAISAASASSSASTASRDGGDYWVKQYTGSVEATRDTGLQHARLGARGDGARRRRDRAQLHAQ